MRRTVIILCNALDDATRLARDISTDSPAASRKVFMLAAALSATGQRVIVVSAGRGRPDGSMRLFPSSVKRCDGYVATYLPFAHIPLLSQIITLLTPILVLWRLSHVANLQALIAYNRLPAHVPILIWARLLQYKTVIDIEDGDTRFAKGAVARVVAEFKAYLFDLLCSRGVLLA